MKKILCFIILLIPIFAYADNTKDAVMALKKMEARVQSGISYRDYGNALADAKFPVNLFMESIEVKKNPGLTDSISKVMKHYEFAGDLWNAKIKAPLDDMLHKGLIWDKKAMAKEIKDLYPNVPPPSGLLVKYYSVDLVLSVIWAEASKELENTTRLYAKREGDSSNELDKLKKETERLQKENDILKAKLINKDR